MEPCDMLECWFNDEGYCTSVSDLRNNELGPECPDYDPD